MNSAKASIVGLALCLWTQPAHADLSLHGGSVRNATDACGVSKPLSIQFFGMLSPRLKDIEPGGVREVSLSKGLYDVTVQGNDGAVIESLRIFIGGPGFRLDFGCLPGPAKTPVGQQRAVQIWLANTTGDCGTPQEVEFRLNGAVQGKVEDGGMIRVPSRSKDVLFEVVREGSRVYAEHHATVKDGQTLFHGCTDPVYLRKRSGVSVLFQNSTNLCEGKSKGRYLTLWVDGNRLVGLAPGRKTSVPLRQGNRNLAVYVGMTRELVLKGTKKVSAPFRIHYGCGK